MMERFRIVLFVLVLAMITVFCCGCGDNRSEGEKVRDALKESNFEGLAEFQAGAAKYHEYAAESSGDTYCANCDKYIEGKVRICTFCGQYIK